MPRPGRLAPLLCLLLGCGNGIGVTDASDGSGPTGTPATSHPGTTGTATTGTPTTGTPTTGTPTTGGTGGASGSSGGDSSGTTSAPSTTTGGSTTGTTTGATGTTGTTGTTGATGTSTGGPGFACAQIRGDYGGCATVLGYGFDGTSCQMISGCDCGADCEHLAPDAATCASVCAAAGECNEAAMHAAALAMAPVGVGTFCDEVTGCPEPGSPFAAGLAELYPGLECEQGGFPCAGGQRCHLQWRGTIDATAWQKLCAASLLPAADLQCVVWGP